MVDYLGFLIWQVSGLGEKSRRLSWVKGCESKRERRDPGQERWRRAVKLAKGGREGRRGGGEGVGKSERVSLS